ncbi:TPA: hypothetical protein U5E10_000271 [Yersinia enterocolitica]|uniref:Uncharacterized protein n=1 Tax=Yersinia intermedia TaxID=631 RepID=A0A0T9LS02_YERIN|nr:hypothetical protein [Yersinia rohdei]ELI8121002.1 hypothetical protein [Yersinia enterocolitica]CNF19168.1 Uncharacterised protein [Yersinia intermedia]ELI8387104.1 hypothetical protein [Yersinia enterocolitica]CNJ37637.1 Uncharacterised protein [Yersinia rohdei]CQJ65654.1 Uncharacterised protein [Yersinia enterocolitica]
MARQRKYFHKHKRPKKCPSPIQPKQVPFDRNLIRYTGLFFFLLIAVTIYLTPGG